MRAIGIVILLFFFTSCGKPQDGINGLQGPQGPSGTPGQSCEVTAVAASNDFPYGGALIACPTTSVFVSNGTPGATGATGPTGAQGPQGPASPSGSTAYSIVEVMNPCGNTTPFHEVFLRLGNGQVLASFSDSNGGAFTRLSVLLDGYNLATTDHTNCVFDLTTSGNTRTIQYHNGTSESWTVTQ